MDFGAAPRLRLSTSDPTQIGLDTTSPLPAILLRKLPRNTNPEGLRSMLLFAKDLLGISLIESSPEDAAFSTAIAQFKSMIGAREAQERLDGKMNASNDANMIVEAFVEVLGNGRLSHRLSGRRNTLENNGQRHQSSSASPHGTTEGVSRHPSRYSSTFQSRENISPPLTSPGHVNNEFPIPEHNSHFQNLFSPQSPVSNSIRDRQINSGKAVINDDAADDETGELLKDPLAFARNGRQQGAHRSSNPIPHFGNLTMNSGRNGGTAMPSGNTSGLTSPLPQQQQQPNSHHSQNGGYGKTSPQRLSFPPANPADQNPPCNTLYVGNLPLDTNEDELKRLFSQQRGYKRLCFRMKQNGPMCFVEFESITLATQALSQLYGTLLSNSVKGGIRLSFSKNPLGVRSGQSGPPGPGLGSPGMPPGLGNNIAPPPGFSAGGPPGLNTAGRSGSFAQPGIPDGVSPLYRAHQFGAGNGAFASQLQMHPMSPTYSTTSPPASAGYNHNMSYFTGAS